MKWMVVVLCVAAPSLFGQTEPESLQTDSTLAPAPAIPPAVQSSHVDTLTGYHPTKSAGLAMLFSAVLPGAGQAYNESYWKVPIVVGFGTYFVAEWLHNNRVYHDYRDKYSVSVAAGSPDGDALNLREFYRDQRDTFTWYFFILYFINVADAYVDASLYDFNVSDDLSIRLVPESGTRLALKVSF